MRELILKDFTNEDKVHTGIDLDKLDNIDYIDISIISGDEIADIRFKDGTSIEIDSSKARIISFYDGCYTLYNGKTGENLIDKFVERVTTYDVFMEEAEE